jgi:energy-coupling factor transporter transmembrane protein EcfT
MVLHIGEKINILADKICHASLTYSVISNPVYISLFLTAIVIVLVMVIFKISIKTNRKVFKLFVYMFLITLFIMMIHNRTIYNCALKKSSTQGIREVFAGVEENRINTVTPRTIPDIIGGGNTINNMGDSMGKQPNNISNLSDNDLLFSIKDVSVPIYRNVIH